MGLFLFPDPALCWVFTPDPWVVPDVTTIVRSVVLFGGKIGRPLPGVGFTTVVLFALVVGVVFFLLKKNNAAAPKINSIIVKGQMRLMQGAISFLDPFHLGTVQPIQEQI